MGNTDGTLSTFVFPSLQHFLVCTTVYLPAPSPSHLNYQLYSCCRCSCSHKSDPKPESTYTHLGWLLLSLRCNSSYSATLWCIASNGTNTPPEPEPLHPLQDAWFPLCSISSDQTSSLPSSIEKKSGYPHWYGSFSKTFSAPPNSSGGALTTKPTSKRLLCTFAKANSVGAGQWGTCNKGLIQTKLPRDILQRRAALSTLKK